MIVERADRADGAPLDVVGTLEASSPPLNLGRDSSLVGAAWRRMRGFYRPCSFLDEHGSWKVSPLRVSYI